MQPTKSFLPSCKAFKEESKGWDSLKYYRLLYKFCSYIYSLRDSR